MRVLALSSWEDLQAYAQLTDIPHDIVRPAETGLVMLRGRMGGTGGPFNLGEAPVTRCTVRLASGVEGHGYVLGRDDRHAHLAALADAQMQEDMTSEHQDMLHELQQKIDQRRQETAAKAAATKVDFFTLVRGE